MASLRQRMLEDIQVRRLSPCTQRTYVETVARFARYFDRSPARLGPQDIRAYQVHLTTERRLAPSSLVVAVSALRFLYRVTLQKRWAFDDVISAPKKSRSLPVVLSPEEVAQFLDGVKSIAGCRRSPDARSRYPSKASPAGVSISHGNSAGSPGMGTGETIRSRSRGPSRTTSTGSCP